MSSPGSASTGKMACIPGVLKQGYLTKKGQNYKTWRKRYFIVLDGYILYFKDSGDLFHPLGIIYLQESFLDRDPFYQKKDNTFVIRSQSKRFMLSAETVEEKEAWVRVLDRIINQSSMRAKFQQQNANVVSGDSTEPLGDTLIEELQKEKEVSLRILQTLNFVDKPLGLLLSGVEDWNRLLKKNEYKSEDEADANIQRLSKRLALASFRKKKLKKLKKKKHDNSSDDNSNSSNSSDEENNVDSDNENVQKIPTLNDENDLRTFTLTAYSTSNYRANTSQSTKDLNPLDRLKLIKDDLQKAFDMYEEAKGKYKDQIATYKKKLKVKKYLPFWKDQMELLKEEHSTIRKDFLLLNQYAVDSLAEVNNHMKQTVYQIGKLVTSVSAGTSSISGEANGSHSDTNASAAPSVNLSLLETENEKISRELEQVKEENQKLKEQIDGMTKNEQDLQKQVKELTHHKKLLIREVKNLRQK